MKMSSAAVCLARFGLIFIIQTYANNNDDDNDKKDDNNINGNIRFNNSSVVIIVITIVIIIFQYDYICINEKDSIYLFIRLFYLFIYFCFFIYIFQRYLTLRSLPSHKWEIGKQCRPRSDAAERGV